jgi:hypothetical protein
MSESISETWIKRQSPDLNTDHKFYEIITETGETICIINTDFNRFADLIAAAPDLADSAQKLIVEIGDAVLDEMRPVWGNTQVGCIENRRNNLKLALLKAVDLESKPVATAQPSAPVASSNPPNAKPVETRFCAYCLDDKKIYWWDALWGNHNSGNGYIGMAPYGKSRDGSSNRSNMTLIDPDSCIILPYSTNYKVQDFLNQTSNI